MQEWNLFYGDGERHSITWTVDRELADQCNMDQLTIDLANYSLLESAIPGDEGTVYYGFTGIDYENEDVGDNRVNVGIIWHLPVDAQPRHYEELDPYMGNPFAYAYYKMELDQYE